MATIDNVSTGFAGTTTKPPSNDGAIGLFVFPGNPGASGGPATDATPSPPAGGANSAAAANAGGNGNSNAGNGVAFQTRDNGDDPCSNDNPEWDKETQPCPGADGIFDGVIETNESNDGDGLNLSEFGTTTVATAPATAAETTTVSGSDNNDAFETSTVDDPASYPSFYSCTASEDNLVQQEGSGNDKLELRFDYEIYTSPNADATEVVSTFERQMAKGVASSLGLADCPDGSPEVAVEFAKRSVGGVRRTLQKATALAQRDRMLSADVIGLSMNPADELDTGIAGCSSTVTLDVESQCSPIIGLMTAWVSSTQRRHLRSLADTKEEQEAMLLTEVQTYIEQNQAAYLNGDLLHVAYIEDRDMEVDANQDQLDKGSITQVPIEANDDGSKNALAISLAAVAVVLVLSMFGVAYAKRRRRSRAGSSQSSESGAFPGLTPESNDFRRDFDDDEELAVQDENVPSSNLFGLGTRSDDEKFKEESDLVPPSSLAVLGAASTLARSMSQSPPLDEAPASPPSAPESPMTSPGPPMNSPATTSTGYYAEEQNTSGDSGASDLQPTKLDMAPTAGDMAPFSPMGPDDDGADDSILSSAFEHLDEYDKENVTPGLLGSPGPLSSPSESTVMASNETGGDFGVPADYENDDNDEPRPNIHLV